MTVNNGIPWTFQVLYFCLIYNTAVSYMDLEVLDWKYNDISLVFVGFPWKLFL